MAVTAGGPPCLTDAYVDALAFEFLNSRFADDTYADWSLDRRLDGFLRQRKLVRLIEDGDAYELILDRVMCYIGALRRGC
jgi:hypothetical protein